MNNIEKTSILDTVHHIKFNGKQLLLLIVCLTLIIQIFFNSLINFVNINIFLTFLLVISTILYTSLTNSLVNETLKMREFQSSPNIVIYIQPHSDHFNFIELIIENMGNGSAHNVNFFILKTNKESSNEYKFLSKLNLISNGIELLASKQKIKTFVTSMFENFEEKKDMYIIFKIKYNDIEGKPFEKTQKIDFSELIGLRSIGENSSYSISKSLKKIASAVECIVSENKLSVNIFDSKDRRQKQIYDEQFLKSASKILGKIEDSPIIDKSFSNLSSKSSLSHKNLTSNFSLPIRKFTKKCLTHIPIKKV